MPTLKLHYDGWLALPAGLRQKLGLKCDRVEAELVDGGLVLRPVAGPEPSPGPSAGGSPCRKCCNDTAARA